MRIYQEKGSVLAQLNAAGRPIYFIQSENFQRNQTEQPQNVIVTGGKKRFNLPKNEIARKNIFNTPYNVITPDTRLYEQLDFDRNLITYDIEGANAGSKINSSLKNLYKAQEIQKKLYQFLNSHKLNLVQQNLQQRGHSQNQIDEGIQQQLQKLQYFQQQNSLRQPNFLNKPSDYSSSVQNTTQKGQIRAISSSFQEAGKNSIQTYRSNIKDYGIWGFQKLGRKNQYPVNGFGKGLKDLEIL